MSIRYSKQGHHKSHRNGDNFKSSHFYNNTLAAPSPLELFDGVGIRKGALLNNSSDSVNLSPPPNPSSPLGLPKLHKSTSSSSTNLLNSRSLPLSPPASERSPFTYAESGNSSEERETADQSGPCPLKRYSSSSSFTTETCDGMGKIEEKTAVPAQPLFDLKNNSSPRTHIELNHFEKKLQSFAQFMAPNSADNKDSTYGGHIKDLSLLASQHDKLLDDVINTDPSFFLENPLFQQKKPAPSTPFIGSNKHDHMLALLPPSHHPANLWPFTMPNAQPNFSYSNALPPNNLEAFEALSHILFPKPSSGYNTSSRFHGGPTPDNILFNKLDIETNNNLTLTTCSKEPNTSQSNPLETRLNSTYHKYKRILGRIHKLQSFCVLKNAKHEYDLLCKRLISTPSADSEIITPRRQFDFGEVLSQIHHFTSSFQIDPEATDVSSEDELDESDCLLTNRLDTVNKRFASRNAASFTGRQKVLNSESTIYNSTTITTTPTNLKWEQSRASMAKRWTWVTHQIYMLDRKIARTKDINFHLRSCKKGVSFEGKTNSLTSNIPASALEPTKFSESCARCVPLAMPFPRRRHYPNLALLHSLADGVSGDFDNLSHQKRMEIRIATAKLAEFGVKPSAEKNVSVLKNYPWFNPLLTNSNLPLPLLANIALRTKPFKTEIARADTLLEMKTEKNNEVELHQTKQTSSSSSKRHTIATETASNSSSTSSNQVKRIKKLSHGVPSPLIHHPKNHKSSSNTTPYHRSVHSSYDIDDMDITFNISDIESIILPHFKEILTPKWKFEPLPKDASFYNQAPKDVLKTFETPFIHETHEKHRERERTDRLSFLIKKRGSGSSSSLSSSNTNIKSTTSKTFSKLNNTTSHKTSKCFNNQILLDNKNVTAYENNTHQSTKNNNSDRSLPTLEIPIYPTTVASSTCKTSQKISDHRHDEDNFLNSLNDPSLIGYGFDIRDFSSYTLFPSLTADSNILDSMDFDEFDKMFASSLTDLI